MTCGRRQDSEADTAVMRARIAAVAAEAEPDLDEASIAVAVATAAPNLRHTAWLDEALAAGPAALFGGSVAPPVVDRLVVELQAAGATRISLPTCHVCGTTRWLTQRVNGLRTCNWCAIKARVEVCGRCQRQGPVTTRDPGGNAICYGCRNKDASKFEACSRCARHARVTVRTADGGALCDNCGRSRPVLACGICGKGRPATSGGARSTPRCSSCSRRRAQCSVCGLQDRVVAMVWPSGPVCSTCHKKALSAKGICTGCSRRRRIDPRDPGGRGQCSECAGLEPWSVCDSCGVEERIYDSGRCIGCTLDDRLAELIGGSVVLAPLRNTLAGSGGPRAALRWLSKLETTQVLGAMAHGELAVTHDALDELPPTGSLEHLRQVLVAAKVLPERDEATARLEAWVQTQLDAIVEVEDRRVVEAFANWWVLRRYRWRLGKYGMASDKHARCLVRGAVDFMLWVRDHELTLGDCTQAHVELWMAGPPSRSQARDFLRWACRRRLAHDLDIVRRPDVIPGRSVDADEHLLLAQRFAYDETLPLVDRVAGLLLLCYGQPLSRLARLKIGHVTTSGAGTSIHFGRTDVELHEVIGRLVEDLVANRKGRASTGASDQSPWLFPGAQPGRPITPNRLGLRLGAYGIDARAARTSLMLDLAAELGPRFLADLLGMHPGTAVRWVRAANGDWSGYAAARARRSSR